MNGTAVLERVWPTVGTCFRRGLLPDLERSRPPAAHRRRRGRSFPRTSSGNHAGPRAVPPELRRYERRSAAAVGLVLLNDCLRDPSSRRHSDVIVAGPRPQLREVEVALGLAIRRRLRSAPARRRAHPALALSRL